MGLYYPPAIGDFDGTNDYLSRASDLTGNVDGKTGILSVWFRVDGGDGDTRYFITNPGARFAVLLGGANKPQVVGRNTTNDIILSAFTNPEILANEATYHHVVFSWDLATQTVHGYVDDSTSLSISTATNDTIDYTAASWNVASYTTAANKWNGAISELYFAPGQYLDLSVEANRRKFIGADLGPVPLGDDGSRPTGTAPLVYMRTRYDDCGKNSGTGGDFVINGSPADTPGPRPDLRTRSREYYHLRGW